MNNEQILKEIDKLVKECIPAMIKAELEKFIPSFVNHIAHDINANNKNVVNPLKRKVANLKVAVVDLDLDKLVKEHIPVMIRAELDKLMPALGESTGKEMARAIQKNNNYLVPLIEDDLGLLTQKISRLKSRIVDLEEEVFPDECD